MVEEAPSPLIENKFKKLREKMGKAAIKIAEAANYTNAGTVEFIVDNNGNFYFLEVNKRVQVEHPITEEVTGIDIVRYQIMIAMGEPLRHSQSDIQIKGHAIECRINAEDPFDDFRPSPGRIEMYYQPGGRGVRVDTHAYAGYTIPSHYDSMIGKLITYGKDRREAMDKMSRALGEYMLTGVKSTISFQQAIMQDPNFRRGVYSTEFYRTTPERRPPRVDRRQGLGRLGCGDRCLYWNNFGANSFRYSRQLSQVCPPSVSL